jgi:hypothetical protein
VLNRELISLRGDTGLALGSNVSGFRLEAEMASPVMRWLRRNGLMVKPEFSLPWGVCDLVGVKLNPLKVKRRLSYGQTRSVGPLLRLLILSKIPDCDSGKSIGVERLANELSHNVETNVLLRELNTLVRDRFVKNTNRSSFQKLNGWAPLHCRIVAVELKLSRVSEAIDQALSNRAFSTDSYVALPRTCALRLAQADRASHLRRGGIGLLAVSHRACWELIKPRISKGTCDAIIQSHVVERFWRTRDN